MGLHLPPLLGGTQTNNARVYGARCPQGQICVSEEGLPHLIPVQRSSVSWQPTVIVGLLFLLPPSPPDKVLTKERKERKKGAGKTKKYVWFRVPQTNTDPCAFGCSFCTK